jgi:2-methylcitrate dehydratase
MERDDVGEGRVTRRHFISSTAGAGAGVMSLAAIGGSAPDAEAQATSSSAQSPEGPTLSRTLSRYSSNLTYEDLSPEVIRYGKHLLLDTIGVALGAYLSEPSRITRSVIGELGGRPEATIIGSGDRTSASLAALANGAMVRYLDFMDVYFNLDGPHPSENIPVALAMAERQRASGKEMFVGMFLGFELMGRFADTWSTPRLGFHHVTLGGYITPIVAGKILGLTEDQLVNAVGLGGATSHTTSYLGDQVTMIKALGYAFTGQRGIEAALMAQKGMTGPENVLEVFMRVARFTGDVTPLTRGRDTPRILRTAIKPYASEYMTHSPLEALFSIVKDHPLKAEDVDSMNLQTFRTAIGVLARPGAYKPQTRETADHSLPYCLALALVEGDLGPEQFAREQWKDPKIIELMSRITIAEDPAMTKLYPPARPADLQIRTRDGKVYQKRVDYPKGDPHNRMSDEEVQAKFRKLARPLMSESRVDAIIECVNNVDQLRDTGELMALLVV